MRLKRYSRLIVFTLFLSINSAFAQHKTVVFHGRITDKQHKGIPFAAVQNTNTGTGINADARGFYLLKTTLPAALSVFTLAYNIQRKEVNESKTDTVEIDFELEENPEELQAVTIKASHPPQILKEEVNLMDFELKDGKLWLVYSVKGGDKIEIVDSGGRHISQLNLKHRVHKDSINQTPHGFLYSIYKDSLQLYSLDSGKIKVKRMLLSIYQQYSGTLVGFRFPLYYYINFVEGGSGVNYYYYDKSNNKQSIFFKYIDSKLYRANRETAETMLALQLLLAPSMENGDYHSAQMNTLPDSLTYLLGPDADASQTRSIIQNLYLPKGASLQEVENSLASAQAILNSPDPYAVENEYGALALLKSKPFTILRLINDSVYIFNFDNNILSVYSPANDYVRQVPMGINIHAIRYRHKNIIVDEEKQECYFKYEKGEHTYLEKLNLATGNISYKIVLKYPFIAKVRISGGYAYFSYFNTQDKDNIYNGKTCLYKQKLD